MTDFGPYLEFVRIQTEMNKLFESLQELGEPASRSDADEGGWLPNVDVCECVEELRVEAEMPGVLTHLFAEYPRVIAITIVPPQDRAVVYRQEICERVYEGLSLHELLTELISADTTYWMRA